MMAPSQQNASPLQMYWSQSIKTEHFIQPQQSIHLVSPNMVPVRPFDGTSMPLVSLSNRMIPPPVMRNSRFGSSSGCVEKVANGPYSSSFLTQLVGSYETETPEATFIQVELYYSQKHYAKVKRKYASGVPLADELIFEDNMRFTLCSLDGFVLAVMVKGKIMTHSVIWYGNEGSQIVWRRTGDVSLKLASSTLEQSRRNSLSSTFSGISQISYSSVFPYEEPIDRRIHIRPESQIRAEGESGTGETIKSTTDISNSTSSESPTPQSTSTSQIGRRLSDDVLFYQFQEYCANRPSLLQKIIHWGISRTNRRVGAIEISNLAAGRVWVRATVIAPAKVDVENWQEVLDEFKGAYQEVEEGVYMQPLAQPNEPGIQHRLRKNEFGFWIIEEPNAEQDVWFPCAQELPYGNWVDLKDSRKRYNIQIFTLESILNRMTGQWTDLCEMERSIEFLFNLCNQKKLNTKLKARNLKHNISSLRLKLEKQYNLRFAVRVAEAANSIAFEGQDVRSDRNK